MLHYQQSYNFIQETVYQFWNMFYFQVPNKRWGGPNKQVRSEKIPKFNKRGEDGSEFETLLRMIIK